jgi:ketosteroid isomerase-like protein
MQPARSIQLVLVGMCIALVAAVGCSATSPTPPNPGPVPGKTRTTTPVPATDEEAIRQLINAECEAVVQQDVDRLQAMWASNGVVTDAMHTKDNTGDDSTWKGWDALRDRYVNLVFPSNPTFCEHPNIQVAVNGNAATATNSLKIGTTQCDNCNAWTFAKGNDGWKITALTYNLNPQ